ncbi:MAG: type II toxin-antitoxin system HicB family antitoxin [Thaumarchaeota archaeon]|nr:type II toxin-antitoxin system HicB family antitoxin [Nitrososphaerota archaeon]
MTAKRKFTILVEEAAEGGYTGRCLELRGAISHGKTMEELEKNMTEAIKLVLETLEEEARKCKKMIIEIPN